MRLIPEKDAAMLCVEQEKTPGRFRTGVCDALASQFDMVAGAGFEPAAFRL